MFEGKTAEGLAMANAAILIGLIEELIESTSSKIVRPPIGAMPWAPSPSSAATAAANFRARPRGLAGKPLADGLKLCRARFIGRHTPGDPLRLPRRGSTMGKGNDTKSAYRGALTSLRFKDPVAQ
jgi:hypothetical protein